MRQTTMNRSVPSPVYPIAEAADTARAPLEELVENAVWAPSGDNFQPWHFVLDHEASEISLYVDEAKDRSPLNHGYHMSRIACGAAVETLIRVAGHAGWRAEPKRPVGGALATLRFRRGEPVPMPPHLIRARVSNRRRFDGRTLRESVLERLEKATPDSGGIRTVWIHGRERLAALAPIIGRAESIHWLDPGMRESFRNIVRFDRPAAERVAYGLPLAALELPAYKRVLLQVMLHSPSRVVAWSGMLALARRHSRQLVESSSALCLGIAGDYSPDTDIAVGRALQRAWLAMTVEAMAVQVMMATCGLNDVLHFRPPCLDVTYHRDRIQALQADFRAQVPELEPGLRPAFLMRVGYAAPPSGRTGRLPARDVIRDRHA